MVSKFVSPRLATINFFTDGDAVAVNASNGVDDLTNERTSASLLYILRNAATFPDL